MHPHNGPEALPLGISDVIEEPRAADHRLNNTRVLLLDNYPGQGNCCNPGTARSYRDNSPNGDFESDCPGRSYSRRHFSNLKSNVSQAG
ncbi:hypothetical protein V1477_015934 [Vespula maculifrons]|uniref:Uncharacterized protein n=1 Tax=Vespula maculifrons TaxID=7453 RepID=A0ABD2BBK3_VESMC